LIPEQSVLPENSLKIGLITPAEKHFSNCLTETTEAVYSHFNGDNKQGTFSRSDYSTFPKAHSGF
jgi:hypothetical protein